MKLQDWIGREVKKGYNEADVSATYELFQKKKQGMPKDKRDIFQWDAKELEEFFKDHKSSSEKRIESRGTFVEMHEDDRFLIIRADDKAAAEFWGKGTRWCITGEGSYYSDYRDRGVVFYFAIDKQAENQDKWSKVAVCVSDDKIEYYAANDDQVSFSKIPKRYRELLK
jgi:hypothetical protein